MWKHIPGYCKPVISQDHTLSWNIVENLAGQNYSLPLWIQNATDHLFIAVFNKEASFCDNGRL